MPISAASRKPGDAALAAAATTNAAISGPSAVPVLPPT